MAKYKIGEKTVWQKLDRSLFPLHRKFGTGYKAVNIGLRIGDLAAWAIQGWFIYCTYQYVTL